MSFGDKGSIASTARERWDAIASREPDLAERVVDFHLAMVDREIVARLAGAEVAPAITPKRWVEILASARAGRLNYIWDVTERESLAIDNDKRLTDELGAALEEGFG